MTAWGDEVPAKVTRLSAIDTLLCWPETTLGAEVRRLTDNGNECLATVENDCDWAISISDVAEAEAMRLWREKRS